MNSNKVHRVLGLVLVLPLLGWIFTGTVFLVKPGYSGAYEMPVPKLYSLEREIAISPHESWTELRVVKTILGEHLLVKVDGAWQNLNINTLEPQSPPAEAQAFLLLDDAISSNRERYGSVELSENGSYFTSTGVELKFNWDSLYISQSGNDTKLIDTLYKIHYLQWLGQKEANAALGLAGLLALTLLVFYGIVLYVRRRKRLD